MQKYIFVCKKPVKDWLRLAPGLDRFKTTKNRHRPVLSGPVRSFEVLGLRWTGLGLGPHPWGSKNRTGLDL